MDITVAYRSSLVGMRPTLVRLRLVPTARVRYNPFADAIYWSDEVPAKLTDDEEDALRILLRYRTSLIIGRADPMWAPLWGAATELFPRWIGFSEERTRGNRGLVDFYVRSKRRFEAR